MISKLNRTQLKALLGRSDESLSIRMRTGELSKPSNENGTDYWYLDDKIARLFREFHQGEEMTDADLRDAVLASRPASKPDLSKQLADEKEKLARLTEEVKRNNGHYLDIARAVKQMDKVRQLEKQMGVTA